MQFCTKSGVMNAHYHVLPAARVQPAPCPSRQATSTLPHRSVKQRKPTLRKQRHCARIKVAQQEAQQSREADTLVQDVLERIQSSDQGLSLSAQEQTEINKKLDRLDQLGKHQSPRPLESEDIWGNFNVAYTSTLDTTEQNRQPAGGGFRSGLGRSIFQTRRLCQSLFKPDIVTNKVEFALLGFISGYVGLRGKLEPVGSDQDTVKVNFGPPHVRLSGGIDLAIGPGSQVQLTTTYLTPEVRIGKGSRGSAFVFTRGGPSDTAGMDQVCLGRTSPSGWAIITAVLGLLVFAIGKLWQTGALAWRAVASLPAVLTVGLTLAVLRTLTSRPSPQARHAT